MSSNAVLVSFLLAAVAAPAGAQQGPAFRLGDPRTGRPAPAAAEPQEEAVPEPPGAPPEQREARAPQPVEGDVSARLRALDATYLALGASGGPNVSGIVLSFVGGALEIGLGIAFLAIGPDIDQFSAYFITLGATTIVRTIVVDLILRPDPRSVAVRYQHMPGISRAEQLERLEYGETQLAWLAERSFIARITDASLNIAGALAVIPAYLLPKNLATFNALEAVVFIAPAITLVLAIVSLASPTEAEQRWAAYSRMRQQLRERRDRSALEELRIPPPGPSWRAGFAIDPNGGGAAVLGVTF